MLRKLFEEDALSPVIEWTLGVAFMALIAAPVVKTIADTVATKLNAINTAVQNAGVTP